LVRIDPRVDLVAAVNGPRKTLTKNLVRKDLQQFHRRRLEPCGSFGPAPSQPTLTSINTSSRILPLFDHPDKPDRVGAVRMTYGLLRAQYSSTFYQENTIPTP
jgi:hypothetical protein